MRMYITRLWMGIIAVVVGTLIIAFPSLIRWALGIALIVMGVMAIVPALKRWRCAYSNYCISLCSILPELAPAIDRYLATTTDSGHWRSN